MLDYTAALLRGHLQVEGELRALILERCANPAPFRRHRWTFSALLTMARSLIETPPDETWVWEAAERLNGVRNVLAHSLPEQDGDHQKALAALQQLTELVTPHATIPLYAGWNPELPINAALSVPREIACWLNGFRLHEADDWIPHPGPRALP